MLLIKNMYFDDLYNTYFSPDFVLLLPGDVINVVYATTDVITIIAIATITITNKTCNLFKYIFLLHRKQYY